MFKAGDYVVIPSGKFNWLYRVYYLCTQNRVMLYKHDKWCKDTAYQSWPHINLVRHATPEEIAAGHRIDLEALRDCDTPPNCKKFDEQVKR